MPRQKKSRKVGKIGVVKNSSNVRKQTEKRVKKPLGKPAGSRNNEVMMSSPAKESKVNQDPRHGSKKPISLTVEQAPKKTAVQKKYFSPKQELAAIEKDTRLSTLLDKIDSGQALSREDQNYFDRTLARHKELCDLLGLHDDTSEEKSSSTQSDDLYSELDAIDINDFKD